MPLRCWSLFDGFRQVWTGVPECGDAVFVESQLATTRLVAVVPLFQSASDAQRHALQPGPGNATTAHMAVVLKSLRTIGMCSPGKEIPRATVRGLL